MRYFRFFSDAERHDQTATWGPLTVLYEVDDDFAIHRQLRLYGAAPFADKFDRSWPEQLQRIMEDKDSRSRIRTEPLDEETSRSNENAEGSLLMSQCRRVAMGARAYSQSGPFFDAADSATVRRLRYKGAQ